jgi:hypothetical protein
MTTARSGPERLGETGWHSDIGAVIVYSSWIKAE